jgi:Family of unknown function (DUF5985)
MIEGFLLGVCASASFAIALFFLKFWRRTRDSLFLAFGIAFSIEAASRTSVLLLAKPQEGSPWIYGVRLVAFLMILLGIIAKNRSGRN